jgi:DNA-binding GntR family transcriptional regulator
MGEDTAAPGRPESIGRVIVEAVLDAIALGRVPAGAKLGEEDLARVFGVSRTIVREALKELKFLGVAAIFPNRGAYVTRPTPEEAENLYAARRVIEAGLIAEFARHCTANDIRALREHLAAQRAAHRDKKRREYLRLMGDFHLVIAKRAGNPVLVEILERLVTRTSLMTALYVDPQHACAVDEHETLVEALIAGDVGRCVTLMTRHLTTNQKNLRIPAEPPANFNLAAALRPLALKQRSG